MHDVTSPACIDAIIIIQTREEMTERSAGILPVSLPHLDVGKYFQVKLCACIYSSLSISSAVTITTSLMKFILKLQ